MAKHTLTGIVGVPPLDVIRELVASGSRIVDLDEPQVKAGIDRAGCCLPRVYCAILRTVMVNALELRPEVIHMDVGPGKCDCALHTARVLEDRLEDCRVICHRNLDDVPFGTPLCRTRMNPMDKMAAITGSVLDPRPHPELPPCRPSAGFWGVPPRDFSLLAPFPDTTHVYGWSRCMENKTPADLELEAHFNPEIPTVFFAQAFCAKTALARHLAEQHPQALYLDCDVSAGSSARAKIQAFLELSGCLD